MWILGPFTVEEDRLEDGPYLAIGPMFAQYVSWVDGTRNVMERGDTSSNGFADTVKGEHGMTLVELSQWNSGAAHY